MPLFGGEHGPTSGGDGHLADPAAPLAAACGREEDLSIRQRFEQGGARVDLERILSRITKSGNILPGDCHAVKQLLAGDAPGISRGQIAIQAGNAQRLEMLGHCLREIPISPRKGDITVAADVEIRVALIEYPDPRLIA